MKGPVLKISLIFWIAIFLLNPTYADVGQTFDLKEKREVLIIGKSDTNLVKVNALDKAIFKSYDETISRLSNSEKSLEQKHRFLVSITSLSISLFVLAFYLLFVLNERLNWYSGKQNSLKTTLKELVLSLLFRVFPSQKSLLQGRGIHLIVFLCLIGMFFSMMGYLLNLIR